VAGYRELARPAHPGGLRAVGTTLTAGGGGNPAPRYPPPGKGALPERANEWIRTSGTFDAVIDVDQVVRDPAHPARLLASLAAPDHLHPTDAGYAAVADAMPLDFCVR